MRTILFICEHNSARSQIAEAYLNLFAAGDKLFAESAGLEPGSLNPYAVEVLKEEGIDISSNRVKSCFDLYKQQKQYDVIITVCSPAVSAKCPIFPGQVKRFNWPFEDPANLTGSREEILAQTRMIRDQIKEKVKSFIDDYDKTGLKLFIE
jgi:arsenate reductase